MRITPYDLPTALLVGLLTLLCLPLAVRAQGNAPDIPSVYDTTPAPVDIPAADLLARVEKVKNGLFFCEDYPAFGKVDIEFDGFLIPNGAYATVHCTWAKLVSRQGKNIMRAPTAKEKEEAVYVIGSVSRIYMTDRKQEPAYAEGKANLRVPCKFSRVEFTAAEGGVTKQAGKFAVTLNYCRNNRASLRIQAPEKDEPIIVIRDKTGDRLDEDEWSRWQNGQIWNVDYTMKGLIEKIEVFIPIEYVSTIVAVIAGTAPDIMAASRNNTVPVAKYARYMPEPAPVATETLDLEALKAQTKMALQRCCDYNNFNAPELVITLPPILNSAFAKIDCGEPKLFDPDGKTVPYRLIEQPSAQHQSRNIRQFWGEKSGWAEFMRATGTVRIRYPASFKVVTVTKAQPRAGAVAVNFSGALLKIAGIDGIVSANFHLQDRMTLVRAYNGAGLPLKRIESYSGSSFNNNVNWQHFAFWGNPTEARVFTVANWLTLEFPLDDMPMPAKLPDTQRGKKPEGYL